jgi:RecJ-like exonuclease
MESKLVKVNCPRCGGRGGWEGWKDFTCYLCRGEGFRLRRPASVKAAAQRAAAKVRTDHCVKCEQDKAGDKWYGMASGTWCRECFVAFGKDRELKNAEALGREKNRWTLETAIQRRQFCSEQELRVAYASAGS